MCLCNICVLREDVCVRAHNTVMISRNAENTLHIVKSRCKNISELFRFCFRSFSALLRCFRIVFFTCERISYARDNF